MKLRNLILLLTFLVVASVLVCIFTNDRASFHNIISETHKKLANLKKLKDNLKQEKRRELITEEKYLTALGFTDHPNLFHDNVDKENNSLTVLPVLLTAVWPGQVEDALDFIKSSRQFLPEHPILVYSLNLEQAELIVLNKSCNTSICGVRCFNFDFYPKHVSDVTLSAHRPLVIQDALNLVGSVLWLDLSYRITSNNLVSIAQTARQNGVAVWATNTPTSALTHPRMFDFFRTQQQNYYFHRMAELSHIVIYNSARVHYELMLLWVECTLIPECIAPIGAQKSGCRLDKRPHYRYSGCHHYDESALNVLLGLMFHFDASPYLVTEQLFRSVEQTTNRQYENVTNAQKK